MLVSMTSCFHDRDTENSADEFDQSHVIVFLGGGGGCTGKPVYQSLLLLVGLVRCQYIRRHLARLLQGGTDIGWR